MFIAVNVASSAGWLGPTNAGEAALPPSCCSVPCRAPPLQGHAVLQVRRWLLHGMERSQATHAALPAAPADYSRPAPPLQRSRPSLRCRSRPRAGRLEYGGSSFCSRVGDTRPLLLLHLPSPTFTALSWLGHAAARTAWLSSTEPTAAKPPLAAPCKGRLVCCMVHARASLPPARLPRCAAHAALERSGMPQLYASLKYQYLPMPALSSGAGWGAVYQYLDADYDADGFKVSISGCLRGHAMHGTGASAAHAWHADNALRPAAA